MSAAPFDVAVIAQRLRTEVPSLRLVGVAADYEAVKSLASYPVPCAYVVLGAERGVPREQGVAPPGQKVDMEQLTIASFGVIVAARNYRQDAGAARTQEIGVVLALTRKAVIGFTPNIRGARPCTFVRGDLIESDATTALWADVFQTQHSISNR